ncbi:MAG TPA: histidine kinase N-terminal 7TM domain-containing protein [Pseudobacteroides sp.]|nr:histidine kinase N-terminal 7TM domain-containing protein [Pseudobacteroides sp.]
MKWPDIILSFSIAEITFVTLIIMGFRKNKTDLIKSFLILNSCYFFWTFSTFVLLALNNNVNSVIFINLKYITAFFLGPVWFLFYLNFSRSTFIEKRSGKLIVLLFFLPVLILIILYLTRCFGMSMYFFDEKGKITNSKGLWLSMVVQSIYHFAGLLAVLRNAFTRQTKELTILITSGFTVSQLITVIYYGSDLYYIFGYMDIFPFAAMTSLIAFAIASYRYQFMNIMPMALSEIVNSLHEGIMVVDGKGKIASVNILMETLLGIKKSSLIEKNATEVSELILKSWNYNDESREAIISIGRGTQKEVKGVIEHGENKQYEIHCLPLKNANHLIGWVVSFYDIHEHKALLDELGSKNLKLSEAYSKLLEHANVVEELSAYRERSRIAGEIHDSVGHCLSILVATLEVIKMSFGKANDDEILERINSSHLVAKNGLSELRHMVSDFISKKRNGSQLIESIKSMIEGFEATGIKVDFTVQGTYPREVSEVLWTTLYNATAS